MLQYASEYQRSFADECWPLKVRQLVLHAGFAGP